MSSHHKVIPIYMFNLVLRILDELGSNLQQLIADTGLMLADLSDQSTRISFDQALLLIRNAYRASACPSLGLRVARQINISDWGMMGYAISSCSSLEESLSVGLRYAKAATRLTSNILDIDDNSVTVNSRPLFPAGDLEPFLIEEDLGGIINVIHHYFGDSIKPRAVQFSYPRPSYYSLYTEHFHCPVAFDCAENQLIWEVDDIRRPVSTNNPAAAKLAIEQCERLIAEQGPSESICDRVRAIIVQQPGKFMSITQVAVELCMSESSLRRALAGANSSYQRILNDIRRKMASEYLTTSNLTLEEIAYLVGYSDISNFRRAFKKWTGLAPLDYRRKKRPRD